MIEQIRLVNLKSHRDTKLRLNNLTLLCGQNGVGKSSLIHSLLLLRQTDLKNRLDEVLDLNDPLCYIGKTKDILYLYPSEEMGEEISIVLATSSAEFSWVFDTSKESSFLQRVNDISDSDGYKDLSLFKDTFQYISAARTANYKADDYAVEIQKQLSITEGRGELVAQFLYQYGKSLKVNDNLLHPKESDPYLISQVTAWEREISTGVNIKPVPKGDAFEIRYSFDNDKFGPNEGFTDKNVGFGLSYALPVIVAILASEPYSLILLENPEAHLHPYGQAKLAELICFAAEIGIQVIVETHSDHIVNGVLVQCKKYESGERGIDYKKIRIYHFDREESSHSTNSTEVRLKAGGRLENRPPGFFDQLGKDIKTLL